MHAVQHLLAQSLPPSLTTFDKSLLMLFAESIATALEKAHVAIVRFSTMGHLQAILETEAMVSQFQVVCFELEASLAALSHAHATVSSRCFTGALSSETRTQDCCQVKYSAGCCYIRMLLHQAGIPRVQTMVAAACSLPAALIFWTASHVCLF